MPTSTSDRGRSPLGHINATTLDALTSFPQQLEAYYAAIPAKFQNWAPLSWEGVPSEPFTPIAHICHVRDVEIDGYHVRFQRTLNELNPTLATIDGDTLVIERSYATSTAAEVFTAFRAARARTVELVSGLNANELARTALFDGYGTVSLRSLVHYL